MARKRKPRPTKAPGGIVTVKGYKRKLGKLPSRAGNGRFRSGNPQQSLFKGR
jgi:hypothetical protein